MEYDDRESGNRRNVRADGRKDDDARAHEPADADREQMERDPPAGERDPSDVGEGQRGGYYGEPEDAGERGDYGGYGRSGY